ncbi:PepSY-associated TM helix domain-containing protein [Nocardiopsis prasina]|uniref:PepSY-associated TM helix domain-containing protein n=1 Tax=Nocardiopsis prasina TaxID=2015 RepID=UPI00034C6ABC|nr:PepSY-associated TM helix domain-containing protein [Nocardiopsis prasina]
MEPVTTRPVTEDGAPPPRPGVWAQLRPLVLRLHFYAGVLVAPFLLVATVSGLLYVWTPQVEQVLYADQLRVPAAEESLPLAEQVRIARAEVPDANVHSIRPATTPEDSTWVLMDLAESGTGARTTVFVDPHAGEVLGVSESYGTSGALPVRTWIDLLHRQLHLGEVGRLYSELAASWLGVVALGGLALWVARRRRGRQRGGRARSVSLHATTGAWILLVLLFLSATGLTWSQYAGANVSELRERMSWTTPAVSTQTPSASPGVDVGPDAVLASAREAGLDGRVTVDLPTDHTSPYVVTQLERSWPTQADSVAVAQDTGEVVDVVRFEDHPLMAKLSRWGVDAHMGLLFGVPNQLVLTAVCGGLLSVIVLGYRMWWRRRPARAGAWALGRPYPRGSFLALSWPLRVAVVLCCTAVGLALPMLGVSLLVFLVIDALVGRFSGAGRVRAGSG